jgi:hypothetical protein
MEIILGIALVLSIGGFLILLDRKDDRSRDERRELLNRIANPDQMIPPKDVVKSRLEVVKNEAKKADPFMMDEKEQYEYASVGKIDPPLKRGEKD